jgi:hypothetical protein
MPAVFSYLVSAVVERTAILNKGSQSTCAGKPRLKPTAQCNPILQ